MTVHIPRGEKFVAILYADGHTVPQIALVLSVSEYYVRGCIKHTKNRYWMRNRFAGTKLALRACLIEDGHLLLS